MKYKAVVFDLFGTLVENFSRSEYDAVLKQMAEILKVPFDDFKRLWRESFPERVSGGHPSHRDSIERISRSLGADPTSEQIDRAADLRLDYTAHSMVPKPSAVETLNRLREAGYKTALVSDCSHETPAVWDRTPFYTLFDTVVFSCLARMRKPDPRIYRIATDALKVRPRDCLYVGDGSSRELSGAKAVGMHAVLIRDPAETDDTHYTEREDDWDGDRISHLPELFDLL